MSHIVKCAICGQSFDRDVIQAVRHGARRYAHYECMPEGEKVPLPKKDEDLENLLKYINDLFDGKQNHARVNQSIKKFHDELGYSYTGIQKALYYFYNIKGNSLLKANGGISIVPFCYEDAYNYFLALYMAQQANENKKIISRVKEITIKPPAIKRKIKVFNAEEGDINE